MDWKQHHSVTLPSDIIERCLEHGQLMAEKFADPKDIWNVMSAALSSHSAEKNVILLGRSKMAECAFCLWAGIDIDNLNWTAIPDNGTDVLWQSMRIDVKHSSHDNPRYCIWPVNKTFLFVDKKFDIIVQLFGIEPTLMLQGWITKTEFRRWRKIAEGIRGIRDGTRYVYTERLEPIETLTQFVIGQAVDELSLLHKSHLISGE